MLAPKKTIPRLAIAALPLTGLGCAGDNGPSMTEGFEAYCMKTIECYGADWEGNDTVAACVETYEGSYNAEDYSQACLNAYASYFSCMGNLTCEQFVLGEDFTSSPEADACYYAVIDTIEAECPPSEPPPSGV